MLSSFSYFIEILIPVRLIIKSIPPSLVLRLALYDLLMVLKYSLTLYDRIVMITGNDLIGLIWAKATLHRHGCVIGQRLEIG